MADNDPNPELRAEIEAALDAIFPQIEGLIDLQGINASPEFKTLVTDQLNAHKHRESLLIGVANSLDAVVAARDALGADGYPNTDPVPVDALLFAEMEKQRAEVEAAFALFTATAPASRLTVSLGEPAPKK